MKRKNNAMLSALKIAAAVYVGLCALVFLFQRRLVFVPSRDEFQTPADVGLKYEDVWIPTSDGGRVHAWYVPHPEPRGVILFCHGNAGNITHRVATLEIFHRLRYETLLFDYRGYGRSPGKPTEAGVYEDADAAWRWLTEKRGVAPGEIVVFGRSLGGPVAAWAARGRSPRALVLESTFPSLPDVAARIYWFLPVRAFCRMKFDTLAYAREAGCPILVAHSPDDDIVPYACGRRLFEGLPEPKRFFELRGDHNYGFQNMGDAYVEGLDAFLLECEGSK